MTKLCPRGKSAAKRKFAVYPSAYANAYASKICAGKIKDPSGTRRKDWGPKKMNKGGGADASKYKKKDKLFLDKVTDKLNKAGEGYKKIGEAGLKILKGDVKGQPYENKKMVGGMAVNAGSQSALGRLEKSGFKGGGGYFDEQTTNVKGKNKTGPVPGGLTPEIPPSEYMKYKKFKKNKVVSAYTGRAVRQPSETNKEFEMRHEYHTPFGKPQKARGGGIAIKGTNFKGVF
jgi:hypothetical protein